MSSAQLERERLELSAEHIGGIDHTDVTFQPGVTVLTGRNATNRTSLLQALMGVLGSDAVSLKGDAEEGYIELTVGDDTYTRMLTQRNRTVVTSGDLYLTDEEAELADLFALLLE